MALLTKYVDKDTAAPGGNGDVGDKWKYLYEATAAIKTDAGTNQYKVYVKASQSYGTDNGGAGSPSESDDAGHDGAGGDAGSVIYLDQAGGGITLPNVFEGYHTTPGDGGVVTIECNYTGASKLTHGITLAVSGNNYSVFKNFNVLNASGDGIFGSSIADSFTLKNCRVKDCGGDGCSGDDNVQMEACVFDNNGAFGVDVDGDGLFVACIFKNNTNYGLRSISSVCYMCLTYDNIDGNQMECNGTGYFLGCTVDANNGGSSRCIHEDNAAAKVNVVNCIIYDAAIGILADGDAGEHVISRNNLYNSNTDDASNFMSEYDGGDGAPSTGNGVGDLGNVTGVPGFTGTYLPGANAQAAALDHHYTNNFWTSFDAADNPPEPENE